MLRRKLMIVGVAVGILTGLGVATFIYNGYLNRFVFVAQEETSTAQQEINYIKNNINRPCDTLQEMERCQKVEDLLLKSEIY